MNNQTTKENLNIETQQICNHIGKLTKKNIQGLINYNYIPLCSCCHSSLNPNNIKIGVIQITVILCLHCGELFCANQQCFKKHKNQDHLFYLKLKIKDEPPSLLESQKQNTKNQNNGFILCRVCGQIDKQTLLQVKQLDTQIAAKKTQAIKKLSRFTQFIHSMVKTISQTITNKLNQFLQLYCQDEPEVFGLKNLGNTCFLNTVLQSLFYTQPFNHIYYNYVNKVVSDWNFMISKEKQKRRQIEYYYDQTIQKYQSSSWRVVGDKKTKNKQKLARKQLQKFVPSGFVKDSKFNINMSKFIQNVRNFLKQIQQSNIKQKLVFQPIDVLTKLGQFDKKYQLSQQQDAEQLLILIIDLLSQGQMISLIGTSQDKKQRYRKIQTLLGRQKLSPTQQVFGSYLASHIVCLGCNKQSWTVDFTYHFPVPLQGIKADQKSFQGDNTVPIKGINYYKQLYYPIHKKQKPTQNSKFLLPLFHSERLTNKENYYSCQKCSALSAIKQFYIIDQPQILIISFKRFDHHKQNKISKHVKFEQFIDICDFVLQTKDQQNEQIKNKVQNQNLYQLYGVIVHKGDTILTGHYICFIKVKTNQAVISIQRTLWYEFSDQKCRKVTSRDVFRQEAYILLYQKVNKL